ncbi:MAG: acyl-CoA thioesterase [Chitinophagaceae bacterium]
MEKIPASFYTVRFNDCDPFSHLNNARYIDYFLNAREDHLRDFYRIRLTDFAKKGIGWVVSNHEIYYLRPAVYNETVSIHSALIELGDAHVVVEMLMQDESKTTTKAIMWSKFTCIALKTGKKENQPADFMEFARPLIADSIDISGGVKARAARLK